jgi:hypothetical protein
VCLELKSSLYQSGMLRWCGVCGNGPRRVAAVVSVVSGVPGGGVPSSDWRMRVCVCKCIQPCENSPTHVPAALQLGLPLTVVQSPLFLHSVNGQVSNMMAPMSATEVRR